MPEEKPSSSRGLRRTLGALIQCVYVVCVCGGHSLKAPEQICSNTWKLPGREGRLLHIHSGETQISAHVPSLTTRKQGELLG